MNPYHFVNFPKDANDYRVERDCKLRNCVIEALEWYVQVLKSHDVPRNEKRIALRFVAHLVGDIHQPRMPGSPKIGAATALMFGSTAEKRIFTRCGIPGLWSWKKAHRWKSPHEDSVMILDDRKQSQARTPAQWALESLAVVRSQVYSVPESGEITLKSIF